MDINRAADPILLRYRAALDALYGHRIDRVVLYGSRARGDAQPDSDYDIAGFLDALPDRWSEFARLADLRVRFIDETGLFLMRCRIRRPPCKTVRR